MTLTAPRVGLMSRLGKQASGWAQSTHHCLTPSLHTEIVPHDGWQPFPRICKIQQIAIWIIPTLQTRSKEIKLTRCPLYLSIWQMSHSFRDDFEFCRIKTFFFFFFSPQAYFSRFSKGWVLVGNLIHMFMIHFDSTPFKFIFGA